MYRDAKDPYRPLWFSRNFGQGHGNKCLFLSAMALRRLQLGLHFAAAGQQGVHSDSSRRTTARGKAYRSAEIPVCYWILCAYSLDRLSSVASLLANETAGEGRRCWFEILTGENLVSLMHCIGHSISRPLIGIFLTNNLYWESPSFMYLTHISSD